MQLKKLAAVAALGVLFAPAAHADPETVIEINPAIPSAELNRKAAKAQVKLKEVRKRIQTVQKDLKVKQVQQQRAKQVISQTQIALEKARAELAALDKQQRISWEKLQQLQNDLSSLETEVSGTKTQIANLLVSSYKNRRPEALILFFKNVDVAQKGRLLQYSRYINEANNRVLRQLAEQKEQLIQQEAAVKAELARLKKLIAQQQAKLRELGSSHRGAVADSKRLAGEIGRYDANIRQLRQNEQNLNQVLAQIAARRTAQQRNQAAAKRKAAQQRNQTANAKTPTPAPTAQANHVGLARLQGQLRRPASGRVTGRFGQARAGGGVWNGIFIATPATSVRSVAAGEVAYAAHLAGYGNTVIIDHGEGYLSVYSGLGSLSVGAGGKVSANQTLGITGTLPAGEQGLYFEIRYRNRAMNPLAWLR